MTLTARAQDVDAPRLGPHSAFTAGDVPGGTECTSEDWEFVTSQPAVLAMKSRGWVQSAPSHCRAVRLAALPRAKLVQLVGWQHTDVLVGVTLVRPDHDSPVSVILFLGGMVEPFRSEQNNENLAAFNSLTRNYRPSDLAFDLAHLADLSKVYLFATGHGYAPKSEPMVSALMVNDIDSAISKNGSKRVVTLHRVPGRTFGPPAGNWTLTFDTDHNRLKLLSAKLDPS